ncbi:LCP family protein [Paenibacillus senegalensis]|uniref:LCP family protein n=1 Tax=Paenibacillus senegalensis TaxID=1465766 RepID=UPI000288762C|nr:LCP family protein [Paenibacillus senegalensis]
MAELETPANSNTKATRQRQKKKLPVYGKILIVLGVIIVSLLIAAAVYANYLKDKVEDVIESVGTPEVVLPEHSAKVKPLTIMLLGIDHRKETGSLNTDVIMVISLNPEDKSATVVSIPRDVQMFPEGLPHRKANYYYPYFYLQDQETAFAKTKQVFSDYLDIPIDYMVTINFEGFKKVVDELGGLMIDVDMDMCYIDNYDGTNINLKQGLQKLDGKEALDFVRYRKSSSRCAVVTAESSDQERNIRQQQVIDAILKEMLSFNGISKAGQVIQSIGEEMKTDIPSSQIRNFITKYYNIDRSNIAYYSLRGTWISPYIVLEEGELEAVQNALKAELGVDGAVRPSPTPDATKRPGHTVRPGQATPRPSTRPATNPGSTNPGPTPTPQPSGSSAPTVTPPSAPGSVTDDTYGHSDNDSDLPDWLRPSGTSR